ncbi:MAG: plasmid recombination protein [Rikenellaceae bacterium]|jgi:hypothetical protein|nr:plasmid recombination protein [Rikenellaceae bacterium]
MGFAVLHIDKASGNDAAMTAHIERTIDPKNADREQTFLNRRLVEYPAGIENRTQAITHRIETAGITRKIGTNQVRALRVMLSASPEDMERIRATGRLDEWCADSVKWLRDTFGKDNVVSADLHRDEQTPHIHATVVPIVSSERRKKAAKAIDPDSNKRTYRKRPVNAVRLCADDVMTRDNLERFQDTYAEAMAKYGLQRGIRGSDARHISTPQYYRDMYEKKEELKLDVADLEERKQEVNDKIRDLYDRKDEVREKFIDMHERNKQKENEITEKEQRLEQLQRDYEPYSAQDDLNLLTDVFPNTSENLRIAKLCKGMGLAMDAIRKLFGGETITVTGKLHSPEHDRDFDVQEAKLQLTSDLSASNTPHTPNAPANTNRLRLSLNGQNILDWFREQFEKLRQARPYIRQPVQPKQKKGWGI